MANILDKMPAILIRGELLESLRLCYLSGLVVCQSPFTINKNGEFYFSKSSIFLVIFGVIFHTLLIILVICIDCGNIIEQTGLLKLVMDVSHIFWRILT